ncbi:globin [Cronobacter dublinensis]|uniref:globin n=1 Tax=Cronobacter dublinensis TaxID=413497 RepID=UPI000CFC4F38|nr:globin [Cronobacter dublinensis]ELY4001994.1 globin [Cronobacter dublinensis]ELY4511475.1 globin [Cronobacter dublinensis]
MMLYRDLFDESYSRLFPNDDKQPFFDRFYARFIHMTPETEHHFAAVETQTLRRFVYKSFFAMLMVDGVLMVPDFLERLARQQESNGVRLPPNFFAHWRRAILETVAELDPKCDEEVLTAWAMTIAPGLEYMRRQAELNYQPGAQP